MFAAIRAVNAKNHNARNKYTTFEELAAFLKEMGCKHKSNGKAWGWVFPPLAKAREAWRARAGGDWEWLAPDITDWGEKPAKMDYKPIAMEELIELVPHETSLDFLRKVYRSVKQPMSRRMRAAIEAMPHEHPRLGAIATSTMNANDFASMLERAIERNGKVLNATPLALPAPRSADDRG